MPRKKASLTPTEVEILKALRINDCHYTELRNITGRTDRALSLSKKKLEKQKFIENIPGLGYQPYRITKIGKDALDKYEMNESIQDSSIYYSQEITFKVDADAFSEARLDPYPLLQRIDFFPFPTPVQASFYGSERIAYLIDPNYDHHLHYDHEYSKEFLRMIEEDVTPLKPYLNDLLYRNCCDIGEEYEKYLRGNRKNKPKLDINVLNFNWTLSLRFEGKKFFDQIKKFSPPNVAAIPKHIKKLKEDMEERLVGTILMNLVVIGLPGSSSVIPAMIAGGLLDETEGEYLQELYGKIWGSRLELKSDRKCEAKLVVVKTSPSEKEKSRRLFLIKALEHLRKGNGLHLTKKSRYGIEITEDDVFKVFIKRIKKR